MYSDEIGRLQLCVHSEEISRLIPSQFATTQEKETTWFASNKVQTVKGHLIYHVYTYVNSVQSIRVRGGAISSIYSVFYRANKLVGGVL